MMSSAFLEQLKRLNAIGPFDPVVGVTAPAPSIGDKPLTLKSVWELSAHIRHDESFAYLDPVLENPPSALSASQSWINTVKTLENGRTEIGMFKYMLIQFYNCAANKDDRETAGKIIDTCAILDPGPVWHAFPPRMDYNSGPVAAPL